MWVIVAGARYSATSSRNRNVSVQILISQEIEKQSHAANIAEKAEINIAAKRSAADDDNRHLFVLRFFFCEFVCTSSIIFLVVFCFCDGKIVRHVPNFLLKKSSSLLLQKN